MDEKFYFDILLKECGHVTRIYADEFDTFDFHDGEKNIDFYNNGLTVAIFPARCIDQIFNRDDKIVFDSKEG